MLAGVWMWLVLAAENLAETARRAVWWALGPIRFLVRRRLNHIAREYEELAEQMDGLGLREKAATLRTLAAGYKRRAGEW